MPTALLSLWDNTGLTAFAGALQEAGLTMVFTGMRHFRH